MKTIITILSFVYCLLLVTCSNYISSSNTDTSRIAVCYTVNIPDMNQDSLFVSVTIPSWNCSDSVRFLAPPIYADNPVLDQGGDNFFIIEVTDSDGDSISLSYDSVKVGVFNSYSLCFPAEKCPATISYYVKFPFSTEAHMPVPHIESETGYIQGDYLFLAPYKNKETVNIWRDTLFNLLVTYNLGSNVAMFGDPDKSVLYKSVYQLLFSKSVLFSSSAATNQLLYTNESSGQEFRFVNLSTSTIFQQDIIDNTGNDFIKIVADVTPDFGIVANDPYTVITGINNKIGFEGTYAFCLFNPRWEKVEDLAMTMSHEYMHVWIGVLVGDYDDPWWKEGTATYLGVLIPKRLGLVSDEYIYEGLVRDLSSVENIDNYALSDPVVRDLIFQGDIAPGLGTAVYQKGAQINMILDRHIRDASGNTTSFDALLGNFVNRYKGYAFHREEYLAFLNQCSGADVETIFEKYVDEPGAIPMSILEENFNVLDSLGAFGAHTLPARKNRPALNRNPFEILRKSGF